MAARRAAARPVDRVRALSELRRDLRDAIDLLAPEERAKNLPALAKQLREVLAELDALKPPKKEADRVDLLLGQPDEPAGGAAAAG